MKYFCSLFVLDSGRNIYELKNVCNESKLLPNSLGLPFSSSSSVICRQFFPLSLLLHSLSSSCFLTCTHTHTYQHPHTYRSSHARTHTHTRTHSLSLSHAVSIFDRPVFVVHPKSFICDVCFCHLRLSFCPKKAKIIDNFMDNIIFLRIRPRFCVVDKALEVFKQNFLNNSY